MKKLLYMILLCSLLMIGCEKEVEIPKLTEADYVLNNINETNKGIKIGSTLDDFFNAYADYNLMKFEADGSYTVFHKEAILTEEGTYTENSFSFLLPTFFVDGNAMNTDDIATTYGLDKKELPQALRTEDFLAKHTVVYHFFLFDIQGGVVKNVSENSCDFNAELAYDKEHE